MTNNTLMNINTCKKLDGHPFIDNYSTLSWSWFAIKNFRREGGGGVRLIIFITHKIQYYLSKTRVFPVKPAGLGNTHKTQVFANLESASGPWWEDIISCCSHIQSSTRNIAWTSPVPGKHQWPALKSFLFNTTFSWWLSMYSHTRPTGCSVTTARS